MSNFSILNFVHNLIYKICKIISVRVRDLITVYSWQEEEISDLRDILSRIELSASIGVAYSQCNCRAKEELEEILRIVSEVIDEH